MPRATHRDLAFELPDDWEDATVVTLLGPPGAGAERPNVVLARKPVGDAAVDLDAFAAGQEQLIRSMATGVRRTALEPVLVGGPSLGVHAVQQELAFDGPSGRVRQRHAYFQWAGSFFVLTATAPEGSGFDAAAAQLERMLGTLDRP